MVRLSGRKFCLTVSPNVSRIKSLIKTARKRIEFANSTSSLKFGNFVFEAYYSSIVEMSHALLLFRGFSCSNHICLGFYFRDILNNSELFNLFDLCRTRRNSLVYYGLMVPVDESISLCSTATKLFDKLDSFVSHSIPNL